MLVLTMISAKAADWPQFRGPDGQGWAVAANLPVTWSETENVVWKTEIPGEGHSSPVIAGDQIWMTTAITEELTEDQEKEQLAKIKNPRGLKLAGALNLQAVMVDRQTGKLARQITLFHVDTPEPKHSLNSYASPTPVIVDDMVYFHFGTYGTACINRQSGETVWKSDAIHVDHQNGPGSSPVVWEDLLIVHFDGTDNQFITAFNRHTGDVAWQTKRSGEMDPTPELQKAYGTPLIVEAGGRPIVISPAANWVYGYDAKDGSEVWKAHYGKLGFSTVPRPVAADGVVYVTTSFMQSRLLAVRYDGEGDVTDTHIEWMSDRQIPKMPSMLLVKGQLYFVSDNGIATCLKATDGSEIWRGRLSGDYSASPLYANGKIYFFGQNGTATVIEEGPEFKELAKNQLDSGFMASPAVVEDSLYLRTKQALYHVRSTN
jgi:outer membrane protein assembly factor BamB